MVQTYDLETVEAQDILIKVCVKFYNIEICYRGCGEKKSKFSYNLLYTQMHGCRLINGGGAIYFVILM